MEQKKESAPYLEQLTSEQDLKQAIEAMKVALGMLESAEKGKVVIL